MAFECDIAVVGDFRFPGGTSTSTATELRALVKAGYRIALVAMAAPMLTPSRRIHGDIAALIATGAVTLMPQGQAVRARLAILHHPQVFAELPSRPWSVEADKAVLVVHHPPVDGAGVASYNAGETARRLRDVFGEVLWAPVGPLVRQSFERLADPPRLAETDWVNTIDPEGWAVDRPERPPVIGRHSRPDPLKWPADRETFLAAYPEDLEVRFLGYGPELDEITAPRPGNWQIHPFGAMPVRKFLAGIDYFVYFHHPDWIEAFGRAILEAIASGAIAILPPHFEPVFGAGALYAQPEEVGGLVRDLHADPARRAAQVKAGRRILAERYGPDQVAARVADLIGPPAPGKPAAALKPSRVLFFTSNGVGMGHLMRSLAVARRLGPGVEPVIVTLSKAAKVAERDGIHVEYLPFHRRIRMDTDEWNLSLEAELIEILGFHRPDVFVFDGNMPYSGLLSAMRRFPTMWRVWQRRAMWAMDAGRSALQQQGRFDAVIEPGEIAGDLDEGLTREFAGKTLRVAPIRYLQDSEALSRRTAREELGIGAEETVFLLQLGSGNNFRFGAAVDMALARLLAAGVRLISADWIMADAEMPLPEGIERRALFPTARYLAAFDGAVATAGYNTFHENIAAGLPTLFVPNENPEQDRQLLRARYAWITRIGLQGRPSIPLEASQSADTLLNAPQRRDMSRRCRRLARANGAEEAAEFLCELATFTRPLTQPDK